MVNNLLKALECRICNKIYEKPVSLPCGHSVCKQHEKESKEIKCPRCSLKWDVPKNGFVPNKELLEVIFTKIGEIDLGEEHASAVKECTKLKKKMDDIKSNAPLRYIDKLVQNLRTRIDTAKLDLISKIEAKAEKILRNLDDYANCKKDESIKISQKINSKLEEKMLFLDEWETFLVEYKVNVDNYKRIQTECEKSIEDMQNVSNSLEEINRSLGMEFNNMEQLIDDFENIDISNENKSTFKGECFAKLEEDQNTFRLVDLQNNLLACGCINGSITIWNTKTETIERKLSGHEKIIFCMKLLSDGSLASGSSDKTIKIWNPITGQLLQTLEAHNESILSLEQLTNGSLVSGSKDNTLKIWNYQNGELLKNIDIRDTTYDCKLLMNENLACVLERKLIIINPTTEKILHTLESQTFNFLTLLKDGSLAIGQTDSDITIWDCESGALLQTLRGHRSQIYSMALLDDGNLASGAEDGEVRIWDPRKCRTLRSFKMDKAIDSIVSLRPDNILACTSWQCGGLITLWR